MIIRPRLTDYYDIPLLQSEVDFAIPFMDEDIPLYVDPFLMWKSPSQMDNMLHVGIMHSFNSLGQMFLNGEIDHAINNLIYLSICSQGNQIMNVHLRISGRKNAALLGQDIIIIT